MEKALKIMNEFVDKVNEEREPMKDTLWQMSILICSVVLSAFLTSMKQSMVE